MEAKDIPVDVGFGPRSPAHRDERRTPTSGISWDPKHRPASRSQIGWRAWHNSEKQSIL